MSEEERQAIIHLLDKQARYEYCIKNNISFSDEDYEAYIIRQSMINKDKEIERINHIIDKQDRDITTLTKDKIKLKNIINELEKELREALLTFGEFSEDYVDKTIKEIKGENENE